MVAYAGVAIPPGWLKADGSAIDRDRYADLYNVIGELYGFGDRKATFNLPDLRGRTIIGQGRGFGLTSRALASQMGSEEHVLTQNEMPAHTHSVSDPGHTHDMGLGGRGQVSGCNNGGGNMCYGIYNMGHPNNPGTNSITANISLKVAGSGAAHNNMPPSIVLQYMIKY